MAGWFEFEESEHEDFDIDFDWDYGARGAPHRGKPGHQRRGGRQHVGRWIRADWIEGPDAHVLKIDLPGVPRDQVHVGIEEQRTLVISGSKHKDKPDRNKGEKCRYYERFGGEFERVFPLAKSSVKIEEIKAHMEDGVLTVVLPKVKEVEAKRDVRTIDIQCGGRSNAHQQKNSSDVPVSGVGAATA